MQDFIQERLDHALVNQAPIGKFPDLEVYVPLNMGSDHNMLVLSLDAKGFFGHRCFKYELTWQEEEGYEEAVNDGWGHESNHPSLRGTIKKLGGSISQATLWQPLDEAI